MTTYTEWRTLACRGAVDPAPDEQVEGTLLVGTKAALHFCANHSHYGEDSVSIFPAFHNGVRCWIRREDWQAADHYSASGTQEFILSFEDGVKLFLEHGVFEFPAPDTIKESFTEFFEDMGVKGSEDSSPEEEYEGRGNPHVPSARVLAAREVRQSRGPRPPRRS